jgi:hypothetical protein
MILSKERAGGIPAEALDLPDFNEVSLFESWLVFVAIRWT